MPYEESTDDVINANVDFRNVDYQIFTLVQMARILGGCAPALDYSQEAKKLWAKLGEKEKEDVSSYKNWESFPNQQSQILSTIESHNSDRG